jgi:hypothetical protein
MSFDNVPRCQHVKINGTQCGCPALRRRRLCFFHVRCQDQRKRIASDQFKQARFIMPILEDANAIQMALMEIMQLLSMGQMDHKTAGLMLYALQTASVNLRNTRFEPTDVTDVVIDRDDVHRTCINGQQWFEEDYEEEEEATEEADGDDEVEDEDETLIPAAAAQDANEPGATPAQPKPPKKVPTHLTLDEARAKVRGVIENWVMDSVEGKARQALTESSDPDAAP